MRLEAQARIKELYTQPGYRTKLLVFVLIGALLIAGAVLTEEPFWSNLLSDIAITFVTVAAIQILWDFLGGDPVEIHIGSSENRISKSVDHVSTKVDELTGSMDILKDSIVGNIGVERIWPNRRKWSEDPTSGINKWRDWILSAKDVTIISSTLWNNWAKDKNYINELLDKQNHKRSIRIVLYDLESDALITRAKDEKDIQSLGVSQMQKEIADTIAVFADVSRILSSHSLKNVKIGLMADFILSAQILQADDRILVALYQPGKGGSQAPVIQVRGENSAWFKTYSEHIETVWDRSKKQSWDDIRALTEKYKGSIGLSSK